MNKILAHPYQQTTPDHGKMSSTSFSRHYQTYSYSLGVAVKKTDVHGDFKREDNCSRAPLLHHTRAVGPV